MIYLQLFLSFAQIGLFSVGGGYAAIPLVRSQIVDIHGWLTMNEFTDLVTIAEMTPGPISINSATFVGLRVAGIGGALIATFGDILPSCIIVSALAWIYKKYRKTNAFGTVLSGLRPVVAALIAAAGISILRTVAFGGKDLAISLFHVAAFSVFIAAFLVLRKWKLNPILVMVSCGVFSVAFFAITGKSI